ncbi:MAG: transporter [Burkholderiales bacterium]
MKRVLGAGALVLVMCGAAPAQQLEPRAYSPSPVGTHFAVASYLNLKGQVLTDPSVPIQNVQAKIDFFFVGYAYVFGVAGRAASIALAVPYVRGDVSGDVFDAPREVSRAGIGDTRMRFEINLYGNPAMSVKEFMQRDPGFAAGASLSVTAPTGQYESQRLINVGSNRWAFKPEVGFSYPVGDWFFEGSGGVWLYTDNSDFWGGNRRSQDPLYVAQAHAGYNFRPGLWIAMNGAYATGGRTIVNGVENQDVQHNSRYGATLSVPLSRAWSAKVAWSKGFTVRSGGDYDVFTLALQYRWFD